MFFLSCDSVVVTLYSSIKQIEAPFVFDWENAIALHAMQRHRASSHGEGKSHGFCRVSVGTWGIFSSYDGDTHSTREIV